MEFATGQDPHGSTLADNLLQHGVGGLLFSYTRSKAAIADGVVFTVEWSDTKTVATWSTLGVTEAIDSEDDTVQHVTATVPFTGPGARFARLSVAP
jgi:hypothetical protein